MDICLKHSGLFGGGPAGRAVGAGRNLPGMEEAGHLSGLFALFSGDADRVESVG